MTASGNTERTHSIAVSLSCLPPSQLNDYSFYLYYSIYHREKNREKEQFWYGLDRKHAQRIQTIPYTSYIGDCNGSHYLFLIECILN